jgi:Domain of Unknown Function (DUF1540).
MKGVIRMYSSDYNDGVKCTVDDCAYYKKGDHCGIESIEVNPMGQNVTGSDNTMCQSFKPKSKSKR